MTQRLERAHPALFCIFTGLAAFSAYFAMYAFRKPFSAATFDEVAGWSFLLDYKVALIIAQVLGYALSKIIGVKLISEIGHGRRTVALLGLIGLSWLALILFALVPAPWNVAALFLNGLPLGLIWGLVFSYVEGRRTSEVIGAILCATFVLASGAVKSVGRWLLDDMAVSEFWMPAAAGALFFPLLLIAVLGLSILPEPSVADRAERTQRAPMDRDQRAAFFRTHSLALVPLIAAYILLTAFRDFRDNFAAEIWRALGHDDVAGLFTLSELPVAIISLGILAALIAVRNNRRALLAVHAIIGIGAVLIGVSTLAFQAGWLSPLAWMILSGTGLFMGYIPFNAMLFDRMIATTREIGTAGFLIYVADACGYAGTVSLLLFRNFAAIDLPWLEFFQATAYFTSSVCVLCVVISAIHFARPGRGRVAIVAA